MTNKHDISVFVIDPPWPKKKGGIRNVRPKQNRQLDYDTMNTNDIFRLIADLVTFRAANPHTVFLWSVDEFLHEGEHFMEVFGYRRHARFIWDKMNGVAPAFSVRFSHEYVTWFYKPNFIPVAAEMRGKARTVFQSVAREHSRKPDCFYDMVSQFFPESVKMDVFSREKRTGWLQFGNETDKF